MPKKFIVYFGTVWYSSVLFVEDGILKIFSIFQFNDEIFVVY